MTDTTMDASFRLTGRHVLWSILAFFGVVFAVNGYFLYAALSTYTGVVSQQPYVKGLHYNDRIAADALQQSRGWVVKLDVATSRDSLTLALDEPSKAPVTGLKFDGFVGRPSTAAQDIKLEIVEMAPGRYTARLPHLADGAWLVRLDGTLPSAKPGEPPFRYTERLWLKP